MNLLLDVKKIAKLGTLWKWYKQYCLKYMMNFKKHIEKDICIKKWLFLFEFDQQGEGNDFELPYSMAGYQKDSLTDENNGENSNKSF